MRHLIAQLLRHVANRLDKNGGPHVFVLNAWEPNKSVNGSLGKVTWR